IVTWFRPFPEACWHMSEQYKTSIVNDVPDRTAELPPSVEGPAPESDTGVIDKFDSEGTVALPVARTQADPDVSPLPSGSVTLSSKGQLFGNYDLLEEIARGGMGVVYKARQVSLNRIDALKMILDGQLTSKTVVQRFHQEAQAAAALDHPNIVAVYDNGEHDGRHYFAMAFVEGASLSSRVKTHGLPPPQEAAAVVQSI